LTSRFSHITNAAAELRRYASAGIPVLNLLLERGAPQLCGVVILIGCATEQPRPSPPAPPSSPPASPAAETDGRAPRTWSDSIEAIEAAGIRAADGRVARIGAELRIQLLNGRTAIFKDDTTKLSLSPARRYAGYLKAIHSHIVHLVPYEGTGRYLIVDDSTGDTTTVSGLPVPSPNGERFVLTSMAGEEDMDASVIEVWQMVGRKPQIEFWHDTEKEPWEPSDPVWRDSVTIDFVKNSHSDPSEPYVRTRGRLTRSDTAWVLLDSPR